MRKIIPAKLPTCQRDWGIISKYRNILYGITIISIMIYHYTSIYSYYSEMIRPAWAETYYSMIGSIGVEIFLFLSGISCYFAWNKTKSFSAFFKRRIERVLIPYLLVGITFFSIEYIAFERGTVYDFLKDIFFVSFFTKGESRFWYVFTIMVLYSVYPLFYKFLFEKGRHPFYRMLALQLITMFCILALRNSALYKHIQIAVTRIPIFILGCYYGKKVYDATKIRNAELMFAGVGIILKLVTTNMNLDMIYIRYISVLFAFALCIYISLLLQIILSNKQCSKNNILELCGNRSLELYIIHVAIIKLFIDFNLCAVKFTFYILIILISVIVSCIVYKIMPPLIHLIKNFKLTGKTSIPFIFFFVLLIKTFLNIDLCTITVPSDEFNTVSAAAQIMGYDWGNVNSSNGYYGYTAIISYLLAFCFKPLIYNSYLLYQMLLFINSLACALYVAVIYKILVIVGKSSFTHLQYCILALIAGFVPQLFGVSQLTQNESTYVFNHIMVIYTIILYLTTNNTIKKAVYSIGCALFCSLSFAGNNRGIVIIIAICFSIFLVRLIYKKWPIHPAIFGVSLCGTMLLHYKLLYPFFLSFFSENPYNTEASIIFERIPRIFSNWADMKACIVALIGWAYTFIVSTYGCGILLIAFLILWCVNAVAKRNETTLEEDVINIILILWFVGTTALCIISFLDSYQGILQFNFNIAYNPERVDKLFYFRYYIALAPFGISYSLLLLKKYNYMLQKKYIILVCTIFTVVMLFFHGYVTLSINGLSYASSSTNLIGMFLGNWAENYKYGTVSAGRFLICTVISIIIIGSLYFFVKKQKYTNWLTSFLILEIITCTVYSGYYMGPRTHVWADYINTDTVNFLKEEDVRNVYVENKSVAFLYQFALPNVCVYSYFDAPDAIIMDSGDIVLDETYNEYELVLINETTELWLKSNLLKKTDM